MRKHRGGHPDPADAVGHGWVRDRLVREPQRGVQIARDRGGLRAAGREHVRPGTGFDRLLEQAPGELRGLGKRLLPRGLQQLRGAPTGHACAE
jgi:hypothetical protein